MSEQKSSFVKAGALYTVGNILVKGLGFLSIPIFTRLMLPEDYGVYNVFMSYAAVVTIIVNVAFHTNLKNYKFDYPDDFEKYSATCFFLAYFGSAVLFLLTCGFTFFNLVNISYFLITFIALESLAQACVNYYVSYLSLKVKTTSYLIISLLYSVSSILLSVYLIESGFLETAAKNRILGVVIPNLLVAFYITNIFRKNTNFARIKEYLKYGMKISLPLLPHAFAQIILSQFDRMMISEMDSFAAAGIYSFAFNVSSILLIVASSCDTAWEPWFFEKMSTEKYDEIKSNSKIYSVFFLMLAVGLVFSSPEIATLLAPEEYAESVYSAIPLIGSAFFLFMYYLPSGIEYFLKKTAYISIGTVSAAVLNIVLNYFTIKFFGYKAAAFTTSFCYVLYFIFHVLMAKKLIGAEKFNMIFDIKYLLIVCAAFVGMSFFALMFVDNIIVRWLVMSAVCCPAGWYCFKKYRIIKEYN